MANKPIKSIKYPGLPDTYTFVQIGTEAGQAADAKVVEDEISDLKSSLNDHTTFADTVFENGNVDYSLVYTNNGMNQTTGEQSDASPNRASTPAMYFLPQNCNLKVTAYNVTIYRANVYCYDGEKAFIGRIGYVNIIVNQNVPLISGTRYVRFSVIRGDNGNLSPSDAVGAVTYTCAYDGRVKDIEDDIVEINGNIAMVEDTIENIDGEVKREIKSDIIPSLPYKVYKTPNGYVTEKPDMTGFVTVYVDNVNGSDSNDGTENSPVKSLTRGAYLAAKQRNDNNKSAIIKIADNNVIFYDDLPVNGISAVKSLVIMADTSATLVSGKKSTWTASSNHYVSNALTSYNLIGVVDMGTADNYGLYKPMIMKTSEAEVDVTPNSYYLDTTNKIAYVHPATDSDIDDIAVIFSGLYPANILCHSWAEDNFCMMENLTIVGASTMTARASSTVGESITRTCYMLNCKCQYGFNNNVMGFNDFEYTYVVGCVVGYGKLDCLNYHYTRKPTPTNALIVEVNDTYEEAGYYNTTSGGSSDNLSTAHEGVNILRCGCKGNNGDGGMIADVDGCHSVVIDCCVVNSSYADYAGANRPAYFFNDNASAQRQSKAIMQNCFGMDTRNGKMVGAIDLTLNGVNSGGTIEATSIKVGKTLI